MNPSTSDAPREDLPAPAIIDCHVHLNNYHEAVRVSLDESLDKLQAATTPRMVRMLGVKTPLKVPKR